MGPAWRVCWVTATLVTAVSAATATQPAQEHSGPVDLLALPLPVPVRHEDPEGGGVPVGKAVASQCPPARTFSRDLCGAPACLHNHRCPTGRACCFNGCVHTCLLKVDSPPVIDWLEDTSSHLPVLDENAQHFQPVRYEDPAYAEAREEMVQLPGGCTLSGKQYAELQSFMEAPSIDKCMCEKGEVVCSVKMFLS
ncbi:WAP four-disulfide core domain protein 1 [Chionoecetes opilio]|uniref:WAP four-disulfide core domain protein 1 n=1 Tax=Chionoecetes opilio TaxID=41210 RepID=A0A8J4YFK7_CHIOP|nr:WAP four-disulfide core domain protein 1 [Chionoecetes opilio]